MPKTRTFTFTNFNLDFNYELKQNIKYLAYGLETCPTTSRQHHQGFIVFKNQLSSSVKGLKKVGSLCGGAAHVEPMMGNLQSNTEYCSKEGKLIELGDRPAQGDRSDLKAVVDRIASGETTADEICMTDPVYYHMYGRTLTKAEDVAARTRFRTEMTQGIWYWGGTGVGKSHKAFENFDPETHYVKCLTDDWWDGYTGQDVVILNEFRGNIPYSELLALVDKWPHSVKRRNREPMPFVSKTVIITCSLCPADCYHGVAETDSLTQLYRRFQVYELQDRLY